MILQLPGGARKMVSVRGIGELFAGASRLLGAEAALSCAGVPLTPSSALPASLSTVLVEPAAPVAPPALALAPQQPYVASGAPSAAAPSALAPQQPYVASGGASAPAAAPAPESYPECAICLEHFSASFPPTPAGACGHGFHAPCLKAWRAQSAYCPLCRGPMLGAAQPPPPQQQQQQWAPATVVIYTGSGGAGAGGGGGGSLPPPPTVEEALALLLRTRAQIQASPEWRLLAAAVREAGPLLGMAGGAVLRTIARGSPGITGQIAGAILAAGTFGRVIGALGSAAGGAGGGGSVACPHCRTLLGVPPGAARFVCGQCRNVVQL